MMCLTSSKVCEAHLSDFLSKTRGFNDIKMGAALRPEQFPKAGDPLTGRFPRRNTHLMELKTNEYTARPHFYRSYRIPSSKPVYSFSE